MELPLLISFISLFVSVLSFAFNAFYQHLKPASLTLTLGDRLSTFRSSDAGQVGLSLQLGLLNAGAHPAVVLLMTAELRRPDRSSGTTLRWDRFEESAGVTTAGRFSAGYHFAGYADSIVVAPRSVTAKRIQFMGTEGYSLEAAEYDLTVEAFTDPKAKPAAVLRASLSISSDQAERWANTAGAPGSGMSKGAVEMFLNSNRMQPAGTP